jgi:hypothetical protein
VGGITLAFVSAAVLALPLLIVVGPVLAVWPGYYTVGLSADDKGLQVLLSAAMAGAAGLVGGVWLATSGQKSN